jgi:hypothetical protein
VSFITRIPRRRAMGLERSIARAFRADQADRVCRSLIRLADTAEPPARQRMIDLAYCEGAKADVLRALSDGYYGEARQALACWRALHRACHGRRSGRA